MDLIKVCQPIYDLLKIQQLQIILFSSFTLNNYVSIIFLHKSEQKYELEKEQCYPYRIRVLSDNTHTWTSHNFLFF